MTHGVWHEGLGLMSGSSLDGLDIAWCRFRIVEGENPVVAEWTCLEAETIPLPLDWKQRLRDLPEGTARDLALAHAHFGHFLGEACLGFMTRHACRLDYIASHGHTIFHWPDERTTVQIGDGAAISALTGIRAISDFRTADIALGGQGAPLAPLADRYLYPGYDYYLNIGGIANISFSEGGTWNAFDVGPANQVLNELAAEAGYPYDSGGAIAASGRVNEPLLARVNALPFFSQPPPKSLDNGWIRETVLPLYKDQNVPLADRLRTAVEQLAIQTGLVAGRPGRMLASGGGAYNTFLIDRLGWHLNKAHRVEILVPDPIVIEFKEAVLMALMGAFRLAGLPNCLSEVTGAAKDTISGAIYG